MRNVRWVALLLAALLLLSGCKTVETGTLTYETVFEKTNASLKEGHLFFAGKVLEKEQTNTPITYYDGESAANTFYKVEVTEDLFDLLPERTFTVCVMGTAEQFTNRTELEPGNIYLFDCTVWMQGEEVVLLLPTFHNALLQWENGYLSYTEENTRHGVEGDYKDYKAELKKRAGEQGYSAESVLESAKTRLAAATQKDTVHFEALEFEAVDTAAIEATVAGAKARLERAGQLPATNEGVKELLK